MVRRVVHQQDVGLLKHRTRQRELHPPSARQRRHGVHDTRRLSALQLVRASEADARHRVLHSLLRQAGRLDPRVLEDVLDARQVAELTQDVRLDEHRPHLRARREPLHLVVGDGLQQRRLTALVGSQQTVLQTAQELHRRVLQQDLGAVGQREVAVAQLRRVLLLLLLLAAHQRRAHVEQARRHALGLRLVRHLADRLRPRVHVKLLHQEQSLQLVRHVLQQLRVRRRHLLVVAEHLQQLRRPQAHLLLLVDRRLQLLQLLHHRRAHATALRVAGVLRRRLHRRRQLRQQRLRLARHLHELGQVVRDLRALTRDLRDVLVEPTHQQRRHERELRPLHRRHELRARQREHALRHLRRLHQRLEHHRHKVVDVLVLDHGRDVLQRLLRLRAHLRLRVVDHAAHRRHELRHRVAHRLLAVRRERGDRLQAHDLDLPLRRVQAREHVLHRHRRRRVVVRHPLHERQHGVVARLRHGLRLRSDQLERVREQVHQVRLHVAVRLRRQGAEHARARLLQLLLLLVGRQRVLERREEPALRELRTGRVAHELGKLLRVRRGRLRLHRAEHLHGLGGDDGGHGDKVGWLVFGSSFCE
eukprot:Rhum_TRINITY_DN15381_c8_g1::Rhum_TRINITY_DN15381_c8_g1_i1::g.154768::m.154768